MTDELCVAGPRAGMTQAGSGEITPAAADRSTSLAINSGEAAAVRSAPPDEMPAAARAVESNPFHPSHPPFRYAFSIDSEGRLTIKRNGELLDVLHQDTARDLGYFMDGTEKLWGAL